MRKPAFVLTILLLLLGLGWLVFYIREWVGVLFFSGFCLGPLLIHLVPSSLCRTRPAQGTLFVAALGYAFWLVVIWYQAFVLHPDPQSPIALVAAGVYGMPFMVVLWIAAGVAELVLRRADRRASALASKAAEGEPDQDVSGTRQLAEDTGNPYQPPAPSPPPGGTG